MTGVLLRAFDVGLAGLILWTAWRALTVRDAFQGIILFISFGLCMALAWLRLAAPDIALVEAAVGSGITGALLLKFLDRARRAPRSPGSAEPREAEDPQGTRLSSPSLFAFPGRWTGWLFALGCVGWAGILAWAVVSMPEGAGQAERALGALDRSGASNPVTAALLNYRAWDTLLEIAVLLLAVMAAWSMARARPAPAGVPRGPVLHGLEHVLIPVLVLFGGYFLWAGTSRPGGAFQAGALFGGAGILLLLAYGPRLRLPPEAVARWGFSLGLVVFLAAALAAWGSGRAMLEYPAAHAGAWILGIEAACSVSIGLILAALFLGGRAARAEDP